MSPAFGVPEWYKMTEVGVIPGDWRIEKLAQLADIRSGIAKNANAIPKNPITVYYLRVANVQDGYLDLAEMSQLTINRDELNRFLVLPGDMLMNEGGDIDKLGRGALWQGGFHPCIHQNHVFVVRCKPNLSPEYLYARTSTTTARRYFLLAGRQTTNLASINKTSLGQLPISLPPIKAEQQAIAEALSDADALVESLEQLLAKKRQIKQGAMQELLTGQKRLPGFSGDWKTWRFGEVTSPGRDRIDPKFEQPSNFCIELEHIGQGTGSLLGHTETTDESSLKSVFRDGDVLFGKLRAYLKKYWLATCSGVCSTEIWVLKSNESRVLPSFLFQMVSTESFIEAASMAYGTHMPRSDWSAVKNFEVQLPSIEEQAAIATILSTLDSDIAALQSQLVKARQIKQGMAQELLTGRIRLVSPAIPPGVPA